MKPIQTSIISKVVVIAAIIGILLYFNPAKLATSLAQGLDTWVTTEKAKKTVDQDTNPENASEDNEEGKDL